MYKEKLLSDIKEIDKLLEECRRLLEPYVGMEMDKVPFDASKLIETTLSLMVARNQIRNTLMHDFGVFVM